MSVGEVISCCASLDSSGAASESATDLGSTLLDAISDEYVDLVKIIGVLSFLVISKGGDIGEENGGGGDKCAFSDECGKTAVN